MYLELNELVEIHALRTTETNINSALRALQFHSEDKVETSCYYVNPKCFITIGTGKNT